MAAKRILLTGCYGLLGQRIIENMPEGFFVLGTDVDDKVLLHGDNFQYVKLDITKRKDIKAICDELKPEIIINAAAYTDVDKSETDKEQCWRVNVAGVENLLKISKRVNAKFIHLSTDYIFDNKKEIYTEQDNPSPMNYYGKSKLASENLVRSSGIDWAIIRTSTLYDVDMLKGRQSFVSWVIGNLEQQKKIRIVSDQWGNPTLARSLANGVWKIIILDKSGVYHIAGPDLIDRYTFTQNIARHFKLKEDLIRKISTDELDQAAVRPLKIGLDITKAKNELNIELTGIEKGLLLFKKDYLTLHRNN
ncbi:dTDP-4-dehydrorhamnose reductase [candidate division KSB1 bacterium]